VPMPDVNHYQAQARYQQDWRAAQAAEGQRQQELAVYRRQYDDWVQGQLGEIRRHDTGVAEMTVALRRGDVEAVVGGLEALVREYGIDVAQPGGGGWVPARGCRARRTRRGRCGAFGDGLCVADCPYARGVIAVPDELVATLSRFNGAAGRSFAAALPGLAARFCEEWGLRRDGAVMYGVCALVLPVVREADGRRAVLKLQAVDEETAGEPVALGVWSAAGAGAVGLLDHDAGSGAMLLERLDERRPLSAVAGVRVAVGVVGELLARLTSVPAPEGMRGLGDMATRMLDSVPGAVETSVDASERRLLEDCAAAVREVVGEPGDRLLHWDLHYDNVLAGRAEDGRADEWVALDPKPLAGDPGFELFPALVNRFDAAGVRWRFDLLTEALGLDRERARAWTLGRVLQNGLWGIRGGARRLPEDHVEIALRLLGRD
jgi:streptomycin 6-kinase